MTPRQAIHVLADIRVAFALALVAATIATVAAPRRAAGADVAPYDAIIAALGPHVDRNDPLALPLKIKMLAADPYAFWCGAKDPFFTWAKTNAPDWLADHSTYVPAHGHLHLGSIGTYTAHPQFRSLALGLVDFDDAVDLPFQLDVLQGLITLRVIAERQLITATDPSGDPAELLLNAYQDALVAGRTATDMLAGDDKVIALLRATWGRGYDDELLAFTKGGAFRRSILGPDDAVREVLRPAKDRAPALADGIAAAIARDPKVAARLRLGSPNQVLAAVKDVALRTRVGPCAAGLKEYLVLLAHPLAGEHHDIILDLMQQIPSAAERSGAVALDARSPARRHAEEMAVLTDPPAWLNGWCEVGGESYWVTVSEPWSNALDFRDIKNAADLAWAARVWGTVAGAAHGRGGRGATIRQKLTPQVRQLLTARATAYVARLKTDFAQFHNDPRVATDVARADAALDAVAREARHER